MPARDISVGGNKMLLDARPDRLDLRDRMYQPPTLALPPQFPSDDTIGAFIPGYLKQKLVLDQGKEGACTGYGLAAVINYLLWRRATEHQNTRGFLSVSPHMLYDLARFYDEWPGQDYDGSSCRGVMKGWHKHGACAAPLWDQSIYSRPVRRSKSKSGSPPYQPDERWPQDSTHRPLGVYYRIDHRSVTDMQTAIGHVGAVYASATVHEGWSQPTLPRSTTRLRQQDIPRIAFDPDPIQRVGGHAFALVGYNEDGFIVQNSWGTDWGLKGFAVLRYEDWVSNGGDAWVCTLGVPQSNSAIHASRSQRGNGSSMLAGDAKLKVKPTQPAAQPWTEEEAILHSIISDNNGVVQTRLPALGDATLHVNAVAHQRVRDWAASSGVSTPRVLIFIHGGLNSEADAIARARVMGPYLKGNGIYPIFVVWKTGILETIVQTLRDKLQLDSGGGRSEGFFGKVIETVLDGRDRAIEALAHGPLGWAWAQMKDNAEQSSRVGRGTALLKNALTGLKAEWPNVEVHLLGHSAGSIMVGHMLSSGISVSSLTLYAPACTLDFALDHIVPHAPVERTWLHLLTDEAERDDCLESEWIYGKSLLYLVARGFEKVCKTPLAGLARCLDLDVKERDDRLWAPQFWNDVKRWRQWAATLPAQSDGVAAVERVSTAQSKVGGKTVAATHGGFDNDVRTLTRTINRVLGKGPGDGLVVPVEDLNY